MTTPRDIITRSLRLIQVLSAGEAASSEDAEDALIAFNDLLDSWSNETLMTFYEKDETLPLTGAQTYTIGSGGDLDTTRPLKIVGAFVRQNGVDWPLTIVDRRYWERIAYKDTVGLPEILYYEAEFPLGVINLYPKGDTTYTLHLASWKQLPTYSNLSDTISLPPGYERALAYNLAVELAPEYEREPSQAVVARAEQSKRNIKRTNTDPDFMAADPAIRQASGSTYDIRADD